MTTLAVPKNLTNSKGFVFLPRSIYDSLLQALYSKKALSHPKLDKDTVESILEYRWGKAEGPFRTVAAMRKFVEKN